LFVVEREVVLRRSAILPLQIWYW